MLRGKQIFPILNWLPDYKISHFRKDLLGGITVAFLLIPQGMAYAVVAGLPPVYGLYAAIVPQIVYTFFGTSRHLSVGPVAMDSMIVASSISLLTASRSVDYVALVISLSLIVGLTQLVLGVFKLGFITNLFSKPVLKGFVFAAAILICLNQVENLLGIEVANYETFYELLGALYTSQGSIHLPTLILSIAGFGLIVVFRNRRLASVASLLVIFLSTGAVYFIDSQAFGIKMIGAIPSGLPSFSIPDISLINLKMLIPIGLALGLFSFVEAHAISKGLEDVDAKEGSAGTPNQELKALGLANLIGSFFSAYPSGASFSRSVLNAKVGSVTLLAGLITSLSVLVTLLTLTSFFQYIPYPALGVIIIAAVFKLMDLNYARELRRGHRIEFTIFIVTILATLFVGMIAGLFTGMLLSILWLLFRQAVPHIAELGRVQGHSEFRNVDRFSDLETWEHILFLRIDSPLTFINSEAVRKAVLQKSQKRKGLTTIVIDGSSINHIDDTAIRALRALKNWLAKRQIQLLFSDIKGPVRDTMQQTGFMQELGKDHLFFSLQEATSFALGENTDLAKFEKEAFQTNVSK